MFTSIELSHRSSAPKEGGFALIIAISLMGMILLVLVSLATFVSVEAQSANATRLIVQARANAICGLSAAFGKLQRLAGPDQRSTASAFILTSDGYSGLTPNSQKTHWTGVWDTQSYDPKAPQVHDFAGWLVSGVNVGALLNTIETPVDSPVLLVGEGSVDDPSKVVRAPRVPLPAGGDQGGYAFWVSDESQKVRINLIDPFSSATVDEEEFIYRETISQRSGGSLLLADTIHGPDTGGDREATIDSFQSNPDVQRMIELGDLPQVNEEWGIVPPATFHDLSTWSRGLFTNTLEGGLRTDLTTLLRQSPLPVGYVQDHLYKFSDSALIEDYEVRGPRWEVVQSFFNQPKNLDSATGVTDVIPTQSANSGHNGLGEYLKDVFNNWYPETWGPYEFRMENRDQDEELQSSPIAPILTEFAVIFTVERSGGRVVVTQHPYVEITNPYDVPLEGRRYQLVLHDIDLLYDFRLEDADGVLPDKVFSDDIQNTANDLQLRRYGKMIGRALSKSGGGQHIDLRFVDQDETALLPGETKTFVADGIKDIYNQSKTELDMVAGTDWLNGGFSFPVLLEDPANNNSPSAIFWPDDDTGYEFLTVTTEHFLVEPWNTNRERLTGAYRLSWRIDSSDPQASSWVLLSESRYYREPDIDGNGSPDDFSSNDTLPWPTPQAEPVFVLHGKMQSADDPMNSGNFLSRYNPRAIVGSTRHSDGGAEALRIRNSTVKLIEDTSQFSPQNDGGSGGYWGGTDGPGGGGSSVLWSSPRSEPMSIGQLRHANLSMMTHEPAYALGNSIIPEQPFASDKTYEVFDQEFSTTSGSNAGEIDQPNLIVDISWHLNRAVWDEYFFSTLPSSLDPAILEGSDPLPNSRIVPSSDADSVTLSDSAVAASQLFLEGPFNVNSTSIAAWTAFLGSMLNIPHSDIDGSIVDSRHAFPRVGNPPDVAANSFGGVVDLTDQQIRDLAEGVVEEVKLRGPFASIADFVNRQLVDSASDPNETGQRGALEAAIRRANINGGESDQLPQMLAQHDLLEPLAPFLAVRGDTFLIRFYGDTRSPQTGDVEGTARGEVVVQRIPQYVDPVANAPEDTTASLSAENELLGRGFRVVSFRWLDDNDV